MKTSEIVVAANRITVDGQTVFQQAAHADFDSFARAAFKYLDVAYPKFYKMDRLCKLGFLAAEYLFAGNPAGRPDEATAVVLYSASGSMDSDMLHLSNIDQPSPSVFVYTLPNIVAGEIAIRHGIKGETAFFVCRHEDDPMPLQYATDLLTNGIASTCLTGWINCTKEAYVARLRWMTNTV